MSPLHTERLSTPTHLERDSSQGLLRRLGRDVMRLIDHELALATAEMKQHIEALARTTMLFLASGFLGMVGLLLLANAAALAVGRAIDSMIGGYLIVGAAIALISAVVVAVARSRLAAQALTPTRALDELRRQHDG
ncbi:MAG TPA: phage holin family protein [Candidatus Methylomirabilis sp.]|nr:phage holin family protein [Candidatus Methylomirabilis sp.]